MPKLFGKADRDAKGDVSSSYPAWYFEVQTEELQEEIDRMKRKMDVGGVPSDHLPYAKRELEEMENQLARVKDSEPKMRPKDKDDAAQVYGELGEAISETLFTHSEMRSGKVSPHKEVKRMSKPCIPVTSEAMAAACKECGVEIKGGKITRNEATRVHKILGKYLGESTNIEDLRKE